MFSSKSTISWKNYCYVASQHSTEPIFGKKWYTSTWLTSKKLPVKDILKIYFDTRTSWKMTRCACRPLTLFEIGVFSSYQIAFDNECIIVCTMLWHVHFVFSPRSYASLTRFVFFPIVRNSLKLWSKYQWTFLEPCLIIESSCRKVRTCKSGSKMSSSRFAYTVRKPVTAKVLTFLPEAACCFWRRKTLSGNDISPTALLETLIIACVKKLSWHLLCNLCLHSVKLRHCLCVQLRSLASWVYAAFIAGKIVFATWEKST